MWRDLCDLTSPHSPIPSLCPHFFLLDASYFMFQQPLGTTHFCNFHLVFFFWWLFMMVSLGYPFTISIWLPSILYNPPWMSPFLDTIPDNPPPRWLILQLWVLLYPMPLLPVLNYNYLLSEYLLCPTSSILERLKGKKCGIHLCLSIPPITVPGLRIYRVLDGCGLGLGSGGIAMRRLEGWIKVSCTWVGGVELIFDSTD